MAFEVAIRAMRTDAGTWKTTSETLDQASQAASGLTLGKTHLSFVSDETGLLDAYEKIRSTVERLTSEGGNRLSELSQTLYKVADAYEKSDESAKNLYGKVWDPQA
jgi:hypothetical protein